MRFAANGTVLSGTIDEKVTIALQENKYGFVEFKSDTVLTFDDEGQIVAGTLADDTRLRPVGWKQGHTDAASAGFLMFKGNRAIEFDADGYVISDTLKEAAAWKNADGEAVALPPKARVRFSENGAEILDPGK